MKLSYTFFVVFLSEAVAFLHIGQHNAQMKHNLHCKLLLPQEKCWKERKYCYINDQISKRDANHPNDTMDAIAGQNLESLIVT